MISKRRIGTDMGDEVATYAHNSIKYHRRTCIPEEAPEFFGIEAEPMRARPVLIVAWYKCPSNPVDSFEKHERKL